jgi:MerR family transcriptional regulator, heat shock protein HspR
MTTQVRQDWRLRDAAGMMRIPRARIRRYVQRGLVRPSRIEGRIVFFGEDDLARLRKIRRLTEDVGLNAAGVEVVLRLLDEIDGLRHEIERTATTGSRRD